MEQITEKFGENFILIKPKEDLISIVEFLPEPQRKQFKDRSLEIRNADIEILRTKDSAIILPLSGLRFSCRKNEEKIICETEKNIE